MGYLTEYIRKIQKGFEPEMELNSLIKKYNKEKDTYLFIYSSAINKINIPDLALSMDDYFVIYDMLKNLNKDKIDFYIETPGGSGEAAEEIVEFLHRQFNNVSFVVSGEAKSAGTLIVLSGDDIYMTESGSLGPIDAQIQIGRGRISAYDYKEWVEEKYDEAEKKKELNPFDAVMIAQISPGELKGVYNSLEYAGDLVKKWLPKYKYKNWKKTETRGLDVTPKMKIKAADNVVEELWNHRKWRSHGRSIKIDDLTNIGLKIKRIDDNKKLCDIVYRIQTILRLIFDSSTAYKLFATESETIKRTADSKKNVQKIVPRNKADVVELRINCEKCGKEHFLYAKFINDIRIDADFKRKKALPFPKNNRLKCDCGFIMDLTGLKRDLETSIGEKIIN